MPSLRRVDLSVLSCAAALLLAAAPASADPGEAIFSASSTAEAVYGHAVAREGLLMPAVFWDAYDREMARRAEAAEAAGEVFAPVSPAAWGAGQAEPPGFAGAGGF